MSEVVQSTPKVKKKRLAFRIASQLPQPLRFVYYILLFGTLLYVVYLLLEGLRTIITFLFSRPVFYSIVICIVVLILFEYFDIELQFIDEAILWIEEQVELIKTQLEQLLPQIENILKNGI